MYQPLSLFIGLRYTRAKRRNQYISFVSLVSLLGMILGVAALVVVLSVMNGFEAELRNRILSVVPHGSIEGPNKRLSGWRQWQQQLQAFPEVLAGAPYIDGKVMLSRPGMMRPAVLHGIDPVAEEGVSNIGASVIRGDLSAVQAGKYELVIGDILARNMGLYPGDEVSIILPKVTVTPLGLFPRVKRFKVAGVFQVGAELDSNTIFIHWEDAARLFQLGEDVHGLRIKVADLYQSKQLLMPLLEVFPAGASVVTWSETQGSLFRAVKMEKTMVSLLLMIIVIIAAFNIVSIITMMVADKRSDIAVLRTMGASPGSVLAVFMIQGIAVGLAGVLVGLLIGVPLALYVGDIVIALEGLFGAQVFNPNVYFISRIPSVLILDDVVLVAVSGFTLSLLATIYPSIRAARIAPAEALRYE
ncbi:MAG: lipoprotein-releasing system permease protein [Oceanicoccus sp.]|jgi:lipoprotein-releasing system permease protein